ncbi:flagellar hook-length control protein FliK [Thiocystis violacea]|uniref:flagellar hook-length control protein FliK n=1 Tax=Thiocystis violacea TaxID=13725 RepID=UPI0019047064|nr:flagellar hook-length control protein FliK [Thiocystis violacea]
MQTTTLQSAAAGLLSQLLNAGLGDGTVLESADDRAFVDTMGHQLRDLLSRSGLDKDALSGIDNEALVAEFLGFMQGQTPMAEVDAVSPRGGAVSLLQQALGSLGASIEAEDAPGEDDGATSDANGAVDFGALPSFVLQLLSASGTTPANLSRAGDVPQRSGAEGSTLMPVAFESDAWRGRIERPDGTGERFALGQVSGMVSEDQGTVPGATQTVALDALSSFLLRLGGLAGQPSMPLTSGVDLGPVEVESGGSTAQAWLKSFREAFVTGTSDPAGVATVDGGSGDVGDASRTASAVRETLMGRLGRLGRGFPQADLAGSADAGRAEVNAFLGGIAASDSGATQRQAGVKGTQRLDLMRLLQPGGEASLADRIRWHAQAGLETVELKLHPPSLGTLNIRVTREEDKTHVQFVTPHPIVKEVLEAAMPRLREALGQEGLSPGDLSVFGEAADRDGAFRQGASSPSPDRQDVDALGEEAVEDLGLAAGTLSTLSRRLDYFV